ncbi:Hypothetical protein RG1141_CH01360 [Neorhizobium galegae bv. officinalis bv. officinalis str. HAMBI 1141]|uniref:Uncharacterized protein n=1 Tax=Neorhizobium galegae bv. officinalis bv. officinalis str. HAMBI 1141 TaxID=1028801 RepID=A0A068T394_NEOGA|nr:hypothetical protein [Neorhizobium galegae]CDN52501.1 Hypothetical protein RG1141_CH01360 [Neorhizobium galegae bv. officinalis bv. officinalis str. HAMBI 1141]
MTFTPKMLTDLAYFFTNTDRSALEQAGIINPGKSGDDKWKRYNHNFDIFILKSDEQQLTVLAKLVNDYVSSFSPPPSSHRVGFTAAEIEQAAANYDRMASVYEARAADPACENPAHYRRAAENQRQEARHIRSASPQEHMLRLAVAAVLEADTEFRSNMMPGWEGDPLSDEIDGLRRIFEASPPPQPNVRVTPEIAARVLYENWSGLANLPSPARELASQGHFFSALRLLFEPDADLTKPPKATSSLDDFHPDDIAVDRFAAAMKAKLARKRDEGRGGWEDKDECSQLFLSQLLREHVEKGDPLDVGNLAMMLHQREERISSLLETLQGE